jgi:hypothetical protein
VFYRSEVESPATLRRVSAIGGYLWLALSFQLFFVAFLAAAVLPPAAVVYSVLGVAALILAAIVLTRPNQPVFIASTAVGCLSTLAGLMALSRPSLLPVALLLAFLGASLAATVVSVVGARLSSRHRWAVSSEQRNIHCEHS